MKNSTLFLLIIVCLAFIQCQQVEESGSGGAYSVWDGHSKTRPSDLSDSTRTFTIRKASELAWLADATNNNTYYDGFEGYTIKLETDIDLGGVYSGGKWSSKGKRWIPIGSQMNSKHFRGTFQGNHHKIRNLYVNNPEAKLSGLFGYSEGIIQDLVLESGTISHPDSIGLRYQAGICAYNAGEISGCVNKASVYSKDAFLYVGGICGYSTGKILRCENFGPLEGTGIHTKANESEYENNFIRGYGYVGGISGYSSALLSDSKNHGRVILRNNYSGYAGGICGMSTSQISHCEQDGTIAILDYCYGGVIGGITGQGGLVSGCTNTGAICPNIYVAICGGVAGYITSGIEGCENRGKISPSGARYLGGICGQGVQYIINIENCINHVDIDVRSSRGYQCIGGIGCAAKVVRNCINLGTIQCDSIGLWSNNTSVSGIVCAAYEIRNCRNQGDIIAREGQWINLGGISSSNSNSYDCLNSGNLSIQTSEVPTFILMGGISSGGNAFRCLNTGSISYVGTNTEQRNSVQIFIGGILGNGNIMSECLNSGSIITSNSTGNSYNVIHVGGISGHGYQYFKCINRGSISGNQTAGEPFVGGVTGYADVNVFACKNVGEVLINTNKRAGIAGYLGGSISSSISVGNNTIAGIVGSIGATASLSRCFYTASTASGTTMMNPGGGQFSESAWPDALMEGWGATAPVNWTADTFGAWENPWSSLGAWNNGQAIYPISSIETE